MNLNDGAGGASRFGAGASSHCLNPSNIHRINVKSMNYQAVVNQPMLHRAGGAYIPRASQAPRIPRHHTYGVVTPHEPTELLFRIMRLQGQIPFGWDDQTLNAEANSWVWLDIHANPAYRNDDDRDPGNGAEKEQTKQ